MIGILVQIFIVFSLSKDLRLNINQRSKPTQLSHPFTPPRVSPQVPPAFIKYLVMICTVPFFALSPVLRWHPGREELVGRYRNIKNTATAMTTPVCLMVVLLCDKCLFDYMSRCWLVFISLKPNSILIDDLLPFPVF